MKKILNIVFLLISIASFSATRTIANAGGNYNVAATWVENAVPTASDTVVATATSGNLTITATASAKTVDFTGYTGTVTINSGITWTVAGDFKLVSGQATPSGTGTLKFNSAGTSNLTSANKTIPWALTINPANGGTFVFADDWNVTGNVISVNGSGNNVLNSNNLNCFGDFTANGGTTTGTTTINIKTTSGTWSGTGNFRNNVVINSASGTVNIGNVTYNTGTITYTAGTINATGTLTITVATTLNCGGMSGGNAWNNVTINGNITITLSSNLYIAGTLTTANNNIVFTNNGLYLSGTWTDNRITGVMSGTARIVFAGTLAYSAASVTTGRISNDILVATAGTITLSNTLQLGSGTFEDSVGTISASSATLSVVTASETFSGNGFTVGSLSCATGGITMTLAAGQTYTVNSALTLSGTAASHLSMVSSTGGTQAILTLNSGATQDVSFVTATDIDSHSGRTIRNYKGTHSNTSNWNSLTPPTTVGYTF